MIGKEKLVEDIDKYFKAEGLPLYFDAFNEIKSLDCQAIANFILADRKQILEEIEKPLKDVFRKKFVVLKDYFAAINETLNLIYRMKGE